MRVERDAVHAFLYRNFFKRQDEFAPNTTLAVGRQNGHASQLALPVLPANQAGGSNGFFSIKSKHVACIIIALVAVRFGNALFPGKYI
jgi:hypothetical protein